MDYIIIISFIIIPFALLVANIICIYRNLFREAVGKSFIRCNIIALIVIVVDFASFLFLPLSFYIFYFLLAAALMVLILLNWKYAVPGRRQLHGGTAVRYDAKGRLIHMKCKDGYNERFEYGDDGHLKSVHVRNALGKETAYKANGGKIKK